MAGHSKWANIKHRKGAVDAKRGKIFTKLVKEISVAAKLGGSDLQANPRLRIAVQNAKGQNVPKENIERAVKKGSGDDAANYTELTYEGYAPHGVALYVECATDNLNRTIANIRSYFNKVGGSLATNGSLDFIFDRKGVFHFKTPQQIPEEDWTLALIEAGAEDLEQQDDYCLVSCALEDFGALQKALEQLQIEAENAELQRIPATLVKLDKEEELKKVLKLIDLLEDDDDVQKIWHNLEEPE